MKTARPIEMSPLVFALGFRIKSGYAVAVALSGPVETPAPLGRFVVALSDPAIPETKQPFHDGLGTAQEDARVIGRLTRIVSRCAAASVGALLADAKLAGRCAGAALVVGSTIDPATVGNPHIRAHANEGRLFRTVVEEALRAHAIDVRVVVEKTLAGAAAKTIGLPAASVGTTVAALGKALGSPWRGEEKAAAMAAWMVLPGPYG